MRINVSESGSSQVLWYKVIVYPLYAIFLYLNPIFIQERFLTDDEIVEHIVVYIRSNGMRIFSLKTPY